MFLCINDVLEVGAEPGLPVPAGSPSPAVSSRGRSASACQRGHRWLHAVTHGDGGDARAQAWPQSLHPVPE